MDTCRPRRSPRCPRRSPRPPQPHRAAANSSTPPPRSSPSRATTPPPYARSRTMRACSRAASTTTSTPRSRCSRILRSFLDELWDGYDAVLAPGSGPARALEALVTESFREIDRHRAAVAIYQKESSNWSRRSVRVPRRVPAQVREGVAVHAGARGRARLPRRPGRPAHLPVRARHGVGRRVLVPAQRTAQPGGDRPAVPVDGAGRDRRTYVTHITRRVWGVAMAEAYIVEAVRTPRRAAQEGSPSCAPGRPGRACAEGTGLAVGRGSGGRRGRGPRLSGHRGPRAGDIARTCWLAAGCPTRRCRA